MTRQMIRVLGPVLTAAALSGCGAGGPQGGVSEPAAPVKLDVIFVATHLEIVKAMLTLGGVTPDDVVYDLGCGDGRIVVAAARAYGARAIGIDIDPQRIAEANANAKTAAVEGRVKFILGDLFEQDFKEATVVTLYLLNTLNLKLRPKLWKELKPGTRVVSHTFNMGD